MCIHPGAQPIFTAYPALNLNEEALRQPTDAEYHGHAHVILNDVVGGQFMIGRLSEK